MSPKEKKCLFQFLSVRRLGDNGGHGPPQRIRLCLASASPKREICDNHGWRADDGDDDQDSGQESDYENHPGEGRLRNMAGEVLSCKINYKERPSKLCKGEQDGWR